MRQIFRGAFLVVLGLSIVVGCSKESGEPSAKDAKIVRDGALATLGDTISLALNETITRLRYGDKSGLYENEFDYLVEDTSFDDYLKFPQIVYASADTLEYLEVTSAERLGDSATVNVLVHFKGISGKEHALDDKITVYFYKGRWIKPTVSRYEHEMLYQDLIQKADSAAAAEAGN